MLQHINLDDEPDEKGMIKKKNKITTKQKGEIRKPLAIKFI